MRWRVLAVAAAARLTTWGHGKTSVKSGREVFYSWVARTEVKSNRRVSAFESMKILGEGS